MIQSFPNVRFLLVCFASISVALPVGIISVAKLLLFVCALAVIISGWMGRGDIAANLPGSATFMILAALAVISASALWSTGSTREILTALAKHGKLLTIPIFLCLVRSRREASIALALFVGGQVFLLASTWAMFLGLSIPWAISKESGMSYAVFSSYLDQSIMTGVLAALCWHMRPYMPTRYGTLLVLVFSGLALACVFFIFQGRTGHAVSIALITLAVFWEMPRQFRFAILTVPFALVFFLAATSNKVHDGLVEIGQVATASRPADIPVSSGTRVKLWHRSLQSIAENPLYGTGVGSWTQEFNRQQERHEPLTLVKIAGNPHQEFLLWGVELGVGGIALLCLIILSIYGDSRRFDQQTRRALQSVLMAMTVACLFNSALYDAQIGDYFCVALGLLLALGYHVKPAALPFASPPVCS